MILAQVVKRMTDEAKAQHGCPGRLKRCLGRKDEVCLVSLKSLALYINHHLSQLSRAAPVKVGDFTASGLQCCDRTHHGGRRSVSSIVPKWRRYSGRRCRQIQTSEG